ncbi:hypothetical protein R3P38DRAFT_3470632 [Favolaschia claudopus]|uniref:Uncharacterized protein n=1 Tax=Favolaschia claudopus TaxID=2862362 RepID=A0AAV9ZD02_9AGAR
MRRLTPSVCLRPPGSKPAGKQVQTQRTAATIASSKSNWNGASASFNSPQTDLILRSAPPAVLSNSGPVVDSGLNRLPESPRTIRRRPDINVALNPMISRMIKRVENVDVRPRRHRTLRPLHFYGLSPPPPLTYPPPPARSLPGSQRHRDSPSHTPSTTLGLRRPHAPPQRAPHSHLAPSSPAPRHPPPPAAVPTLTYAYTYTYTSSPDACVPRKLRPARHGPRDRQKAGDALRNPAFPVYRECSIT